jgi:hypothetical protein
MQASDDRPTPWRRFARVKIAGRRNDIIGLIDEELRLVFSAANIPSELDDAHRLLAQIDAKRKHG